MFNDDDDNDDFLDKFSDDEFGAWKPLTMESLDAIYRYCADSYVQMVNARDVYGVAQLYLVADDIKDFLNSEVITAQISTASKISLMKRKDGAEDLDPSITNLRKGCENYSAYIRGHEKTLFDMELYARDNIGGFTKTSTRENVFDYIKSLNDPTVHIDLTEKGYPKQKDNKSPHISVAFKNPNSIIVWDDYLAVCVRDEAVDGVRIDMVEYRVDSDLQKSDADLAMMMEKSMTVFGTVVDNISKFYDEMVLPEDKQTSLEDWAF